MNFFLYLIYLGVICDAAHFEIKRPQKGARITNFFKYNNQFS
jgi:hypothetical protein